MRTRVQVGFHSGKRPWRQIEEILHSAGQVAAVRKGPNFLHVHDAVFWEDDPRLSGLLERLDRAGMVPLQRREHVYTQAELNTSPLLWLSVRSAEKGFGGPSYGTEYDLSEACSSCGTGARQTGHLRLRPVEIPRRGSIFQTLDNEILLSTELGTRLRALEISGLELWPVESATKERELPWLQLRAPFELPPMSPLTAGLLREAPCRGCSRDGHFNSAFEPLEITYEPDTIRMEDLPEAVHTYEHFGYSALRDPLSDSHFAQPLLLVGPRVRQFFRAERVRSVKFTPIHLATEN